jgi:5-methyltetrahydropteroyltriglutamate--homocysteine methyltransferase
MMRLVTASTGSYPRVGDSAPAQRHRRAYAERERGEISEAQWREVEDQVTAEVVREQVAAGIELPTDGQIRWYDPISHVARHLEGVTIDGLLRYFDTNFYFRQPVVSGPIARRAPFLAREYEVARMAAGGPVKAVLTGPYSLARGSILEGGYPSRRDLAQAYAEVLALEVADLARAGVTVIQVDEPFLLRHPEDVAQVRDLLSALARVRGSARLACYTFFGDALPLYDELQAFPVDVLGFDFTYSPSLAQRIAEAGTAKTLGLGLVDGRNTKLETREGLFPILDRILPRAGESAYLGPSCGLEFLPRDRARQKLETMTALAREYAATRRS